jgi:hypothetical protein
MLRRLRRLDPLRAGAAARCVRTCMRGARAHLYVMLYVDLIEQS